MLSIALRVLAALLLCLVCGAARAQEQAADPVEQLPWQAGPAKGAIGERASIDVPKGYRFLGPEGVRKLDELFQNPPDDRQQYVLAPDDLSWVAYFTFDDIGYVKDDEKLESDAILQSIREGTEASNEVRRERGWDTMRIVGWSFEPQYDKQLNALEWAFVGETEQSKNRVVNYNTRLLGRHGVMQVIVVTEPDALTPAIAKFKGLMPGYKFASGESYAEFRPGDHVAEIGLAALITGGAAAVAAKKGWFAALAVALAKGWKLLLVGLAAAGVGLRKFFAGRKARTAS